jgi:hypothetical protein
MSSYVCSRFKYEQRKFNCKNGNFVEFLFWQRQDRQPVVRDKNTKGHKIKNPLIDLIELFWVANGLVKVRKCSFTVNEMAKIARSSTNRPKFRDGFFYPR